MITFRSIAFTLAAFVLAGSCGCSSDAPAPPTPPAPTTQPAPSTPPAPSTQPAPATQPLPPAQPAPTPRAASTQSPTPSGAGATAEKVVKTEAEWKAQLTAEQFRITRQKGTERAFTGEYWDHKGVGTYVCVCCGQPLYSSSTKFKSGTGWPSFWQPVDESAVAEDVDDSYGMVRTEILCSRCDAHLGHVFADGPPPTGMRHCVNSASLRFEPAK